MATPTTNMALPTRRNCKPIFIRRNGKVVRVHKRDAARQHPRRRSFLLNLPLELREKIYMLVLPRNEDLPSETAECPSDTSQTSPRSSTKHRTHNFKTIKPPALALVNHQLFKEVTAVYFAEQVFSFAFRLTFTLPRLGVEGGQLTGIQPAQTAANHSAQPVHSTGIATQIQQITAGQAAPPAGAPQPMPGWWPVQGAQHAQAAQQQQQTAALNGTLQMLALQNPPATVSLPAAGTSHAGAPFYAGLFAMPITTPFNPQQGYTPGQQAFQQMMAQTFAPVGQAPNHTQPVGIPAGPQVLPTNIPTGLQQLVNSILGAPPPTLPPFNPSQLPPTPQVPVPPNTAATGTSPLGQQQPPAPQPQLQMPLPPYLPAHPDFPQLGYNSFTESAITKATQSWLDKAGPAVRMRKLELQVMLPDLGLVGSARISVNAGGAHVRIQYTGLVRAEYGDEPYGADLYPEEKVAVAKARTTLADLVRALTKEENFEGFTVADVERLGQAFNVGEVMASTDD